MIAQFLINTVGTSAKANLDRLSETSDRSEAQRAIGAAVQAGEWERVGLMLRLLDPHDRLCGAEINAIACMEDAGHVAPNCGLVFLHSATVDGRHVAAMLKAYYQGTGHRSVVTREIGHLQDGDPKRFRTKGLRQLVSSMCEILRERSPHACAINATGGYKAQIALAVVIGQALAVPVYYLHERFAEIIAIPPMPVTLDRGLWMRASGMLADLAVSREPIPVEAYEEDIDEQVESLIERISLDGRTYLDITPIGQILHETLKDQYVRQRKALLPAERKQLPHFEDSGWPGEFPQLRRLIDRLTAEIPYVIKFSTHYYKPDLPQRTRCRQSAKGPELVWSDGTATARFHITTTATDPEQEQAVVVEINNWLAVHYA